MLAGHDADRIEELRIVAEYLLSDQHSSLTSRFIYVVWRVIVISLSCAFSLVLLAFPRGKFDFIQFLAQCEGSKVKDCALLHRTLILLEVEVPN